MIINSPKFAPANVSLYTVIRTYYPAPKLLHFINTSKQKCEIMLKALAHFGSTARMVAAGVPCLGDLTGLCLTYKTELTSQQPTLIST